MLHGSHGRARYGPALTCQVTRGTAYLLPPPSSSSILGARDAKAGRSPIRRSGTMGGPGTLTPALSRRERGVAAPLARSAILGVHEPPFPRPAPHRRASPPSEPSSSPRTRRGRTCTSPTPPRTPRSTRTPDRKAIAGPLLKGCEALLANDAVMAYSLAERAVAFEETAGGLRCLARLPSTVGSARHRRGSPAQGPGALPQGGRLRPGAGQAAARGEGRPGRHRRAEQGAHQGAPGRRGEEAPAEGQEPLRRGGPGPRRGRAHRAAHEWRGASPPAARLSPPSPGTRAAPRPPASPTSPAWARTACAPAPTAASC